VKAVRGVIKAVAAGLAALLLILAVAVGWLQLDAGRRWLGRMLEIVLSDPGEPATVATLTGTAPFDVTVSEIRIGDVDGDWLRLERVHLALDVWSLITGRLRARVLEVARLTVERPPEPSPQPGRTLADRLPRLPILPVGLAVDGLAVDEVVLAPPVLGRRATLRVAGAGGLAPWGGALDVHVRADPTDGLLGRARLDATVDPRADRLDLALDVDEPPGGLIGRLLDLPGPGDAGPGRVQVVLTGSGPLSDWRGRLNATGGDGAWLTADGAVTKADGGHAVNVDARAAPGRLADSPAARTAGSVIGREPRLDLAALVAPNGAVTLGRTRLALAAGLLNVTGTLAPGGRLALDVGAAAGPDSSLVALLPGMAWRDGQIAGRLEGTLAQPRFEFRADVHGLRLDDLVLDRLAGPSPALELRGSMTGDGRHVTIDTGRLTTAAGTAALRGLATRRADGVRTVSLAGTVDGVASGVPEVDALLGKTVRLKIAATADPDGTARLEEVVVDGANLTARAAGTLAGGRLDGRGGVEVVSLRPLGEVLGTPLEGAATLEATASGPQDGPAVDARLTVRGLAVNGRPLATVDAPATLAATLAARAPGGGSPAGSRGHVEVRLAGPGAGLTATAEVRLDGAMVVMPDVAVFSGANRLAGALQADPARRVVHGRLEGRLPDLAGLSALLAGPGGPGGVWLSGAGRLAVTLDGRDGRQSAVVTASADSIAAGEPGTPPVVTARTMTLSGDVADALRAPTGRMRLELLDARAGGVAVAQLAATAAGGLEPGGRARATVQGRLVQASLAGEVGGLSTDLDLAGTLALEPGLTRLRLDRLNGRVKGETVTLSQPAALEMGEGRVALSGLALASGAARLSAQAALTDGAIKGEARLERLPLALARLVYAGLGLDGSVDGSLVLAGTLAAPRATAEARVSALRAPATLAGKPSSIDATADATARATWQDGRVTASANATSPGGDVRLEAQASLPLAFDPHTAALAVPRGGRLEASATGTLRLAVVNDLLAAEGDRADGRVVIDLRAEGPLAGPRLGGTVTVTGGRYEHRLSGAVIAGIEARLVGDGQVLTIQSFTGHTPNGGTVTASGSIRPAAVDGRQLDLALGAVNARLLQTDIVTATVEGDLTLTGGFTRALLAGQGRVIRAEVQVPDRLPAGVVDLKAVEVGRPGDPARPAPRRVTAPVQPKAAARMPAKAPGKVQGKAQGKAGARGAAPTPASSTPVQAPASAPAVLVLALDMTVEAENRVEVRGRGLDAVLGGQLHIGGTASEPVVEGRLAMTRGTLAVLGKTFSFKRGILDFDGGPAIDPRLDLLAEASGNDITAQVQVSGTARQPKLELSSAQGLPQDEVLARLLFGKSVSTLGAGEAVQLAQSAAELAGFGGGAGILSRVRRTLGFDRLGITSGQNGKGSELQAGGYIHDRVYVGIEQDLQKGGSRAKVEVNIVDGLQVEAGVGANADTRLGLKFEWDY
jgi:translocation and assembly module TamB